MEALAVCPQAFCYRHFTSCLFYWRNPRCCGSFIPFINIRRFYLLELQPLVLKVYWYIPVVPPKKEQLVMCNQSAGVAQHVTIFIIYGCCHTIFSGAKYPQCILGTAVTPQIRPHRTFGLFQQLIDLLVGGSIFYPAWSKPVHQNHWNLCFCFTSLVVSAVVIRCMAIVSMVMAWLINKIEVSGLSQLLMPLSSVLMKPIFNLPGLLIIHIGLEESITIMSSFKETALYIKMYFSPIVQHQPPLLTAVFSHL